MDIIVSCSQNVPNCNIDVVTKHLPRILELEVEFNGVKRRAADFTPVPFYPDDPDGCVLSALMDPETRPDGGFEVRHSILHGVMQLGKTFGMTIGSIAAAMAGVHSHIGVACNKSMCVTTLQTFDECVLCCSA